MAKYTGFIKNDQWKLLEPLLPKAKRSAKGGRPPIDTPAADVCPCVLDKSPQGPLVASAVVPAYG
jgi:hypothetical protein